MLRFYGFIVVITHDHRPFHLIRFDKGLAQGCLVVPYLAIQNLIGTEILHHQSFPHSR